MAFDASAFWTLRLTTLETVLYVFGGVRFRRWAVEDRVGVPRYSANVETVMLWLIYNAGISVAIIVILQTLRDI